eukprot:6204703-Pleurochrysis_carterae.AAC.1
MTRRLLGAHSGLTAPCIVLASLHFGQRVPIPHPNTMKRLWAVLTIRNAAIKQRRYEPTSADLTAAEAERELLLRWHSSRPLMPAVLVIAYPCSLSRLLQLLLSRRMDGEASSKQPLEADNCPGSSPPIFEAGPCAASCFSAALDAAAGCPGTDSTAKTPAEG